MAEGDVVRQDRVHPLMATAPDHRRRAPASAPALGRSGLHERGDELSLLARSPSAAADLRAELPGRARRWSPTWPTRTAVEALAGLPDALDSVRPHRRAWSSSGRSPSSTRTRCARSSTSTWSRPMLLTRRACRRCGRPAALVVVVNSGAGPDRQRRLVGVRRLEVRPACVRGLAACRGAGARRPGHHGLPRPHRHPDAGEGARAGGQGLRRAAAGSSPRPSPRRSCTSSTCPPTPPSPRSPSAPSSPAPPDCPSSAEVSSSCVPRCVLAHRSVTSCAAPAMRTGKNARLGAQEHALRHARSDTSAGERETGAGSAEGHVEVVDREGGQGAVT